MSAYVCELACLDGGAVEADVVLEIADGRLESVEPGGEAPAGAERLAGLTLPGFANAHSHAFQRALRGRAEAVPGSTFWGWREGMYELAARIDPDSYRTLARATFAEMALAGITAVGEFHYLHHGPDGEPYEDPNELGRVLIAAAREAGIRITLLDTCYLHGGIGAAPSGVQRRFSDGDADAWVARVDSLSDEEGGRIGAAIHSVRAVDPDSAAAVAKWAAERECPLHAHVSEQPAENRDCLGAYDASPTAVLERAGVLSERFTAIHFTHVDERDIASLGAGDARCCLCPTTERALADGIGQAREIANAGTRLALGSDSHALIDPFEEMRAVELNQRLQTGERGHHSAAELLRAGTADGHAAIGWPEAGRIGTGAVADVVTVALDSPRLAGTAAESVLESVVFAATASDVRDVIVAGQRVVREGRHASIDVPAELEAALGAVW